jgi:hypothetical protein
MARLWRSTQTAGPPSTPSRTMAPPALRSTTAQGNANTSHSYTCSRA